MASGSFTLGSHDKVEKLPHKAKKAKPKAKPKQKKKKKR